MLLKVLVNGVVAAVVDAPNKASAKAFGKTKVEVEVQELSGADLQSLDVSTIVKVEPAPKKEAAPAATGEQKAEAAETANAEVGAAAGDTTSYQ